MPIIAFGMGSSLEGQLNAPHGGLCIDMSQMNAILQVNGEDLTATVQAGVTREALNQYLRDTGLFPHRPRGKCYNWRYGSNSCQWY